MRDRISPREYAVVRMLGVAQTNKQSDENFWHHEDDMVCRVQPRVVAACCDDKPTVMGRMSCHLNGDCRGVCCNMLTVFCPIMLIIVLSGGGMFSECTQYKLEQTSLT